MVDTGSTKKTTILSQAEELEKLLDEIQASLSGLGIQSRSDDAVSEPAKPAGIIESIQQTQKNSICRAVDIRERLLFMFNEMR